MFKIGFTQHDLMRVVWAFVFTTLASFIVVVPLVVDNLNKSCAAGTCDWSASKDLVWAAAGGALAAGLSAVKNLVLADTSSVK